MLLIHPAPDLFSADGCFLRQGQIRQIGKQERCQHQILRSFKMPFQQTEIIIGQVHPIFRLFSQGQHAGQHGADLFAPEFGKEACMLSDDFTAFLQPVSVRCLTAGAKHIGTYGIKITAVPSESFTNGIPVYNVIRAEFFQLRFHFVHSFAFIR